jgi:hypothetical protein
MLQRQEKNNHRASINKLVALWAPSGEQPDAEVELSTAEVENNKFWVSLIDELYYEDTLHNMDWTSDFGNEYRRMAGCDLSSLFLPFSTSSSDKMPYYEIVETDGVADRSTSSIGKNLLFTYGIPDHAVSSDELFYAPLSSGWHYGVVSSGGLPGTLDKNYGICEYRSYKDIRSFGMRLPMIGVGWGYSTDGKPVPNNSEGYSSSVFAGECTYGWQVAPEDYVAAPIDFRYDVERGVWTSANIGTGPRVCKVISEVAGTLYVLREYNAAGDGSDDFYADRLEEMDTTDCDFITSPVDETCIAIYSSGYAVEEGGLASGWVFTKPEPGGV